MAGGSFAARCVVAVEGQEALPKVDVEICVERPITAASEIHQRGPRSTASLKLPKSIYTSVSVCLMLCNLSDHIYRDRRRLRRCHCAIATCGGMMAALRAVHHPFWYNLCRLRLQTPRGALSVSICHTASAPSRVIGCAGIPPYFIAKKYPPKPFVHSRSSLSTTRDSGTLIDDLTR